MIFEGTCTALVTPFTSDNKIDFEALAKLVNFQLASGVRTLLALGSTGEGSSLSPSEKEALVSKIRSLLPPTHKLIVGVGSNNACEVIEQIKAAKSWGADACLVQTPYFVKCTQEGIFLHYEKIAKESPLPIIIYNVPSRSGVNVEPETMLRLAKLKNIEGLKEANDNISHIQKMFKTLNDFPIYCGNDNLYHLFLCLGACGVISVASNIVPEKINAMFTRLSQSRKISFELHDLNSLLFSEPNPIPVKFALSQMKLIENNLRPPLTPLSSQNQEKLKRELEK